MPSEHIQLDDNLVLRAATPDDAEKVVELNRLVHGNPEKNEPENYVAEWTKDLFAGATRAIKPADFTVVEDTSTGEIVSSICLMSQTWNIGGIDVPMGMPEIVGTHPDYRRRGLVRKQFDLMHEWSQERGHLFNTIMGIGNYYRQFEYEYAIDAWGGSGGAISTLESVSDTRKPPAKFTARDAEPKDTGFIADTSKTARERVYVTVTKNAQLFEDELFGRSENSAVSYHARILELDGKPAAYYLFQPETENSKIRIDALEITSESNWFDATTSMAIDLQEIAKTFHPEGKERCEKLDFHLATNTRYTTFWINHWVRNGPHTPGT
ncbi:MAG: GNAT family N-acetyltransferase [Dehalococcoidia bacterium]